MTKWYSNRLPKLILGILPVIACAGLVFACGYDAATEHSVRFTWDSERAFGRLHPFPYKFGEHKDRLFNWDEPTPYSQEAEEETPDEVWEYCESQFESQTSDLTEVRQKLRQYLQISRGYDGSESDVQYRRNSAVDRLDALEALDRGASSEAVRSYMIARSFFEGGTAIEALKEKWKLAQFEPQLADNVRYLEAAIDYRDRKWNPDAFLRFARDYPRSEKREAALFTAAMATMKQSASYSVTAIRPGSLSRNCINCQDELWHSARAAFERVMREYPRGRYYWDARGWLGFLSYRDGDNVSALLEYYRMLAGPDEAARINAVLSIMLISSDIEESDLSQLEARFEKEPATGLAYAYHRIYNIPLRWSREEENWDANDPELKRIAQFATRMANRFGSSSLTASFLVRVAEANLELANNDEAARLAARALSLGAKNEYRAQALWIRGVALRRLKQLNEAGRVLQTLVKENPNNRFTEGGRRNLAMVEEDLGHLDRALEQYLALNYRHDVAYFVDVLMTPEQLKSFIDFHPSISHRDELLYGLSVLYLRDRRWNEARTILRSLNPIARDYEEMGFGYDEDEPDHPKIRYFETDLRGVRSSWIHQDLRVVNDLEKLEQEVEAASDDEQKAEALYQVAAYQYEGNLLFYNPLGWKRARHNLLDHLQAQSRFRQPGEAQTLFANIQKHDAASSSLPIFLEVVKRFPNTRAARDAFYTAAVCHERLRDYNDYWRAVYAAGGHAGERFVSYADVRRAYPAYQLPRGTTGWEPSTRTVNGGPGWDKPPRPKPRPSRMQRLVLVLLSTGNRWLGSWYSWIAALTAGISFFYSLITESFRWGLSTTALAFLFVRAREAREQLREELQAGSSSESRHTTSMHRLFGESRLFNRICWIAELRVTERGRRVLILNLATHWMMGSLCLMMLGIPAIQSGLLAIALFVGGMASVISVQLSLRHAPSMSIFSKNAVTTTSRDEQELH